MTIFPNKPLAHENLIVSQRVSEPHDVRGQVQVARKHYVGRNEQLEDHRVVWGAEGGVDQAGIVLD